MFCSVEVTESNSISEMSPVFITGIFNHIRSAASIYDGLAHSKLFICQHCTVPYYLSPTGVHQHLISS